MTHRLKLFLINLNLFNLSQILTLFFIIIHFQKIVKSSPILAIPVLIFASIGLIFQESRQSKILWLGLSALFASYIILHWQLIDNHIYLWGYWTLANFLCLLTKKPIHSLQISAKSLIFSCMFFAVFQKINPVYLSSDFFYYTLITDNRFFFIGRLIDYNMIELINQNNMLISEMKSFTKSVILSSGPHILNSVATFLTWYTIIIEGIICTLFALPRRFAHEWQHWFLFLFFTVYFVLPIEGFAYTLMNMGIILLKKEDLLFKLIYLFLIFYMFAFSSTILNYVYRIIDPSLV